MNAPAPQMLTLTDAAADQVKKLMDDSDTPVTGLRIGVSSKGCSGLSYVFEYAEEKKNLEEEVESKIVTPAAEEVVDEKE